MAVEAVSSKVKETAFARIKDKGIMKAVTEAVKKRELARREKIYRAVDKNPAIIVRVVAQTDFSDPAFADEFFIREERWLEKCLQSDKERAACEKLLSAMSDEKLFEVSRGSSDFKWWAVSALAQKANTFEACVKLLNREKGFQLRGDDYYLVMKKVAKYRTGQSPEALSKLVLTIDNCLNRPSQEALSILKEMDSEVLVLCLEKLWEKTGGGANFQTMAGNLLGDFKEVAPATIKSAFQKYPDRISKVSAVGMMLSYVSVSELGSETVARILSSGIKLDEKMVVSLVKEVAPNDITMAMYEAIPYDSVRKILQAKMPSKLKSELAASSEAAAKSVMEKAKAAAQTTFSLDGFYLGMTAGDAKTMLAYHFPDFTFSDGEDILGKPFILVSGQKTPFCFIDKTSGTVYEFNFGKKMVEKWYKYDVQNALEWAMAFGRANNAKMVLNAKMEETKVYDTDGQRSYPAWLLQERYTHKDNAKKYRITYHGEHKIKCGQSGIASTIIENEAYKDFWHCSADEGALKVTYED